MLLHDVAQQPAAAAESFGAFLLACGRSGMAGCLDSEMDETALVCREHGDVRRRRFFSIEGGEVRREREPARLGLRSEKCLPAHRDQVSRRAPHGDRFAASVCLWRGDQEHLEPEDEHMQGEASSCVLHDWRLARAHLGG